MKRKGLWVSICLLAALAAAVAILLSKEEHIAFVRANAVYFIAGGLSAVIILVSVLLLIQQWRLRPPRERMRFSHGEPPHLQETRRQRAKRFLRFVRECREKEGAFSLVRRAYALAPLTFTFAIASFLALVANALTRGQLHSLFSAYFTAFSDPLMYARLLSKAFMHANFIHYLRNFSAILILGPIVERRFGSLRLLLMMAATSFITGIVHVSFTRDAMLMGASSITYMLIILACFVNVRERRVPIAALAVGLFYLAAEFWNALTLNDNIAHISHAIAVLCGLGFGYLMAGKANANRVMGKA